MVRSVGERVVPLGGGRREGDWGGAATVHVVAEEEELPKVGCGFPVNVWILRSKRCCCCGSHGRREIS